MKMQKIKNDSELPIGAKLVKAESHWIDKSLKGITFTFDNGAVVNCGIIDYSNFSVSIPEQPTMVKRHKVSATVFGVDMSKHFEAESDANTYARKLENTDGRDSEVTQTIVKVADDTPEATQEVPF